jgi:hypothetical protein
MNAIYKALVVINDQHIQAYSLISDSKGATRVMVDLLGVDGIVTSHRLVLMVECEASAIILWLVRMCGICLKFSRICETSRPILFIND